jgi:hypothetical protein
MAIEYTYSVTGYKVIIVKPPKPAISVNDPEPEAWIQLNDGNNFAALTDF